MSQQGLKNADTAGEGSSRLGGDQNDDFQQVLNARMVENI